MTDSDTDTATIVYRSSAGRGDRYHCNESCRFIDDSVTTNYRLAVAESWDNLQRCEVGDCSW